MRDYQQFCGLARALDTIGDRWSLLIVRELLIEPRRYAQLQRGLPGIASNLLAERLRTLQVAGVIEAHPSGESDRTPYALTPWGETLREPIGGLIRWSTPLMVRGRGTDAFEAGWLIVALRALLHDRRADPARQITLEVGGSQLAVRVDADGPHVSTDPIDAGPPIITTPELALAIAAGADVDGLPPRGRPDREELRRLVEVLGSPTS